MAEKEEMRSVHLNMADTQASLNFNWESVRITAEELPALIRCDDKYRNLIQLCQQEVYGEELTCVKKKKPLRSTSRLLALTSFLDDDQLLRLGGRLGRAKLPYDVLHPPILPGNYPLGRSII